MRTVLLLAALSVALITPAAAVSKSIWKKGGDVQGSCAASVNGKPLMAGPCAGAGHGDSVFVTADRDGCSIELTRKGQSATGKIFAYKDNCGELDGDVSLGNFKSEGGCWIGKDARLCLHPGR